MTKVQINLHNKLALVDQDQVGFLLKKESLVKQAVAIQNAMRSSNVKPVFVDNEELMKIMGKIRRLNKKIRQNVQFI